MELRAQTDGHFVEFVVNHIHRFGLGKGIFAQSGIVVHILFVVDQTAGKTDIGPQGYELRHTVFEQERGQRLFSENKHLLGLRAEGFDKVAGKGTCGRLVLFVLNGHRVEGKTERETAYGGIIGFGFLFLGGKGQACHQGNSRKYHYFFHSCFD